MYLGSFLCEQVQISYMRCFSVSYLCCKLLPVTYTRPPPQLLSLAACNKIMIGKFDSHNIPLLLPSLSLALKVKWSQILSQQSAVRIQHAAKTVVRKQFGLRNLLPFFLSLTCVLNFVFRWCYYLVKTLQYWLFLYFFQCFCSTAWLHAHECMLKVNIGLYLDIYVIQLANWKYTDQVFLNHKKCFWL